MVDRYGMSRYSFKVTLRSYVRTFELNVTPEDLSAYIQMYVRNGWGVSVESI